MTSNTNYTKVLSRLQTMWFICFGMITLLAVLGYWVPHIWMPLVGVALCIPVITYSKQSIFSGSSHCSLMGHYTVYTLVISSAVMTAITLINSRWLIESYPLLVNPKLPYISSLVVYPVGAIVFTIGLLRRKHTEYCNACKQRAGYSMRETLERNVFHHEMHNVLRLMCMANYTVAIICVAYYTFFYINVNLNTSDTFFFFVVPFIVFMITAIYVASRYSSMQFDISLMPVSKEITTMARFILIKDNRILLSQYTEKGVPMGLWDNPAHTTISFTESLSDEKARTLLTGLIGTDQFELRSLFVTNTVSHNSFHYAAILPDDADVKMQGEWFSMYEIGQMMKSGMVARPFAYEIHRIYTITMAWKTYDRDGKRLYPIKNYRTTFRLSDFKNWDVDYSDLHWLSVAKNNEDQPFYRLRKFWRKYVSSVDR